MGLDSIKYFLPYLLGWSCCFCPVFYYYSVVSDSFLSVWLKYLTWQFKGGKLYFDSVSEVLVHGRLTPLLWAWHKAEHITVEGNGREKLRSFPWGSRERKGPGMRYRPKGTQARTHSLQRGSTSYSFYHRQWINLLMRLKSTWTKYFPNAPPVDTAVLGITPLTHELWGTIRTLSTSLLC